MSFNVLEIKVKDGKTFSVKQHLKNYLKYCNMETFQANFVFALWTLLEEE